MRRFFTLMLLFLSVNTLYAQRNIDFGIEVSAPAPGDEIISGVPFLLDIDLFNNGPDTALTGDTILLLIYIDTTLVDSGIIMVPQSLLPGSGVMLQIQYSMNIPDSLTGLRSFCMQAYAVNGPLIQEVDSANNYACNSDIDFSNGTMSVVQTGQESSILLFPVPACNSITFRLPASLQGSAFIILYDQNGRKVKELAMAGGGDHVVDIAELAAGNYLYRVKTADEVRYGKFTVVK